MLRLLTSALCLILSCPPFDLGWAAWGALVPWLFDLERSSARRAFLRGFFVGFLFFAGTLWWVGRVTVPGMLLLVAYLALYFGAWSWIAHKALGELGVGREEGGVKNSHPSPISQLLTVLLLPAAWVALEYARSFLLSGFGWNLIGHTQWNWIPLIQIADTTGVWGVSFLVALVNVALWLLIRRGKSGVRREEIGVLGLTLFCLMITLFHGQVRLRPFRPDASLPAPNVFKAVLLQGSIPQSQKWDGAFQETIWKRYETLTAQAAQLEPDLIIWPETALPGFLEELEIRARLDSVARSAGCLLLVGAATEKCATGRLYNSAVLLDPQGEELDRYDKIHLVPFGEYLPLKPILGWLKNVVLIGEFAPGQTFTVFHSSPVTPPPPFSFSVLICFEDLFPALSRRFVREGAQGLFVITNDGWFGRSAASLQHLQASVFRAVENRVWVGRAANTGWTGFIDPNGRRLPAPGQAARFQPAIAVGEIPVGVPPISPYVRWGDWFPMLCLLWTGWAIMKRLRQRWKRSIS